jgi:glycosyltransferase involved in cell wall biosynthesis
MKSVWYISKYFAPGGRSDIGTRSWFILKNFFSRGVVVTAFGSNSNHLADCPDFSGNYLFENYDGINVVWIKTFKYKKATSLLRILNWLHFEWRLYFIDKSKIVKPDVIIISSLSLLTIINGFFLRWKFGAKLIFEIRDIWPLTIVEEGGYSKWNPFVMALGIIEYVGYKYSNLIVGTMPNLHEHVQGLTGDGSNVICVPMGVSCDMLKQGAQLQDGYLEKYLDKQYFNVVHAGTIGITNALETLFSAAELLIENKKIRFVIVGDGNLKKYYEKKYGHLNNVVFAPKVSKAQVNSVLSQSSIVYFSTYKSKVWQYGQSLNKVIDYMLSGRPIVASYSGYPSMINEADCGFFTPAEDHIALANKILEVSLMDPVDLDLIGSRGRPWLIENRSFKRLADYYFDSIEKA